MPFEEIESALKRVAESQVAHAERMDRIDRKLEQIADNQIVQGELLARLDRKVDLLVDVSQDHHQALELLAKVSESNGQQLRELRELSQNHERRLVGVEDQMALMVSSLNGLLQRMDAFIQGLQKGDGHSAGAS